MRLYDIADQYNDLIDMLELDAENDALQAMLDGLNDALEVKIDAVLSVRNSKRAEVKAIRDEINRLTKRAMQVENEANRLESLVENTLNKVGKEKVKTLKFTTWMQLNPHSLVVMDESRVPYSYYIPQPNKLDRAKLLEDIKSGVFKRPEVAIATQNKSLRVR